MRTGIICFPQANHAQPFSAIAPGKHTEAIIDRGQSMVPYFAIILALVYIRHSLFPINMGYMGEVQTTVGKRPVTFRFIPLKHILNVYTLNALVKAKPFYQLRHCVWTL